MSNALKDAAAGRIIKLNLDGRETEFIVAHQGKPSENYDDSCIGTWLLMKDIYTTRQWHTSQTVAYASSAIHSYLNNDYFALFDEEIQKQIKEVKIPYCVGTNDSGAIKNGADGLPTKVFLLSPKEINMSAGRSSQEGSVLDFAKDFIGDYDSRRAAYLNGTVMKWWTRSPRMEGATIVCEQGQFTSVYCNTSHGVRPALVLDPEPFFVTGDGTLLYEDLMVSTEEKPLDAIRNSFTLDYTVNAPSVFGDSEIISVKEHVNDELIREYLTASGAEQRMGVSVDRLPDGFHQMSIEAAVEGMTAKQLLTFRLMPVAGTDNGMVQELQDENKDPVFPATVAKAVITESGKSVERVLSDLDKEPVLLWENASPASEFAAQSVVIPSGKYDRITIQASSGTEDQLYSATLTLKHGEVGCLSVTSGTNRIRKAEFCGDLVVFEDGKHFASYAATATTVLNSAVIPLRIYGVKKENGA